MAGISDIVENKRKELKIMKNRRKRIVTVFMAVVMLLSLFPTAGIVKAAETDEITRLVSEMTMEQKITQMLMPAFRNYDGEKVTALPEEVKSFLGKYTFGGVCLFAENFADTEQSLRLTDELQSSLSESSPQLFISADQEGGRITRINTGTQMPGNMALAATNNSENARKAAEIIGNEMKLLGINMDFAPVIDVNNNPSNPIIGLRSFSDDPETVAEFGRAYMEGLGVSGTIGTVKHFPGHGDTATDSHTGLPSISKSYEELKKLELVPYEKCIASGVDMLMTAHIQYPNIETDTYLASDGTQISLPATLSKKIITGILRNDLGYDGVVTTDAMNMDAIAKKFDRYDAAKLAINAGVDILLMPVAVEKKEDIADFEEYIKVLVKMVSDGEISEENVDKSVERILKLKKEKELLTPYQSGNLDTRIKEAKAYVGSRENHDKEWEIVKQAITLVKNDDNALPIDPSSEKTVVLNHDSDYTLSTEFAIRQLKDNGKIAQDTDIAFTTFSDKDISEIKAFIGDAGNVILDNGIGSKKKLNPEANADIVKIREIIEYVHGNGGKVTIISYSLPYDVGLYQDVDAILLAYSARAMTSLPGEFEDRIVQYGANVPAAIYLCMTQDESPVGVLPVNIPKLTEEYDFSDEILYARGFGLRYASVPVEPPVQEVISLSGKNVEASGLKKSYVYTGKVIKPAVTVKYNGATLIKGRDYQLSFSNNKKVGKAAIKINGIGSYTGTVRKSFDILPKTTKLVKAKGRKTSLVLKWKKQTVQTDGYEIRYSTSRKFLSAKTKKLFVKNKKATEITIKKLKAKTKYYVQIRTYKKVSKKKYYSAWSGTMSAKTYDLRQR